MACMFIKCSSLNKINLSNFNNDHVINLGCIFGECSSLININLSNFNTYNVNNMRSIFKGCESLKKENIITKDKRILNIYVELI